jgi:hypothetical protein
VTSTASAVAWLVLVTALANALTERLVSPELSALKLTEVGRIPEMW